MWSHEGIRVYTPIGMPAVVGAAAAGATGGLLWLTYLSESSTWFLRAGGGGAATSCAFLKASSKSMFIRAGWGRKTYSCASNEVGVCRCHRLLEGFVDALRLISPRQSRSSLCCACVCFSFTFALVYLAGMFGVAEVILFFTVDAWPLHSYRRILCHHLHWWLLCHRSRSPLADALPRGLWRMLCRCSRSPLAYALPRGLWQMLCHRVGCSDGCFAAVLVSSRWKLCHRSFISPACSPCYPLQVQ
jgi:hypothetical protein